MSSYWFFLSYARRNDLSYGRPDDEDKDRKLVKRLYQDLAGEVISKGGAEAPKTETAVGFFDQTGIEPGDRWDDTLALALRTSRVLVCLYSRSYFDSEYCGKEFQVFLARVQAHAKTLHVTHLPLILPVLWHRQDKLPTSLPASTAAIQYTHDAFGGLYAAEGLEYIMRQKRFEDEYQEFLIRFADKLIEVAEKHAMPALAELQAFTAVHSAFHAPKLMPPVTTPHHDEAAQLQNTGPGFAHFAFVVGQRHELQSIRARLDAYANEGRLWKPYIPDVDKPIGLITQRVATDEELQQEVLPITPKLVDKLDKADDTNTIVMMIIDPWSLKVKLYQEQMQQYDKRNLVSCAVLVVWNDQDQEPGSDPEELRLRVKQTFRNNLTNNNMYIRVAICSESALRQELSAAIIEIRRRLNERAKLFRPVDNAGFDAIPTVAGPGGSVS